MLNVHNVLLSGFLFRTYPTSDGNDESYQNQREMFLSDNSNINWFFYPVVLLFSRNQERRGETLIRL